MPKLEIKENKKLILKDIIIKQLRAIPIQEVDRKIQEFLNDLEGKKADGFGPIVIHQISIMTGDNFVKANLDIIVQAHNNNEFSSEYLTKNELTCDNCIYIRFEGLRDEIYFAENKMELYFYENDLVEPSESYKVYINQNPEHMIVDLFKPVKINEIIQ